jgi:hypothetical protein
MQVERLCRININQFTPSSPTIYTHTKYKPWKIKNVIWFDDAEKAIAFERYLKSRSGRAFAKRHF